MGSKGCNRGESRAETRSASDSDGYDEIDNQDDDKCKGESNAVFTNDRKCN